MVIITILGFTLTGFRLAYDWYLNAKLDARKKDSRFHQKRNDLSKYFADFVYPEFAAHERMMKKLELARTIRSLRRGVMSTVSRGEYIRQLEVFFSGSNEDRIARREVVFVFTYYFNPGSYD